MGTNNLQMSKLCLEKEEELEIKLPTFTGLRESKEISEKNIYLCFIDYAKYFDCVDHDKLWKALREMEIPDHLTCLLRNLYVGEEVTELCMEQLIGLRWRTEYHRAVCCHPVCLTYTLST